MGFGKKTIGGWKIHNRGLGKIYMGVGISNRNTYQLSYILAGTNFQQYAVFPQLSTK